MRRITAEREHCEDCFSGLCIAVPVVEHFCPCLPKKPTLIGFVDYLVMVAAAKKAQDVKPCEGETTKANKSWL